MSLCLIASGVLLRDPERRTSSAGKPYGQALLRVSAEAEDSVLVFIVAFSSTVADALLAHERGDSIAVTGRAKLRTWTDKEGAEKHGISVVAEGVLSPYALEKRRRRVRGDAGSDGEDAEAARRTAAAELERVARAQAATGRAQVLTPEGSTTAGLAEMENDLPFEVTR